MKYRYLLVDNDNTLMDFDASERHALTSAPPPLICPTTRRSARGIIKSTGHCGRRWSGARRRRRR